MPRLPALVRACVLASSVALLLACRVALAVGMGSDDARHLLARTGFGGTSAEIGAFARLDREDAIERLLADVRTQAQSAPPAFEDREPWPSAASPLTPDQRRAFVREQAENTQALRGWWIGEMVTTRS